MDDSACPASIHKAQGADCLTCHTDEQGLQVVHEDAAEGAKAPKKLKQTEVPDSVCLECHGSWEELAAKTADSTTLTDSQGTTVNPHALPESGTHQEITCSDCHKMHSDAPVDETSQKVCLSCHHADVYECGTCHE